MTAIHFTTRSRSTNPLCEPALREPVTRIIGDVTCEECKLRHHHREANKNKGGHPRRGDTKIGVTYPAATIAAIAKLAPEGQRAEWLRTVAGQVALDSRPEAITRAVLALGAAGWTVFPREAGDPLTVDEIGDIVQTVFQTLPVWQSIPSEPTGEPT
jgi:hypothetical protein